MNDVIIVIVAIIIGFIARKIYENWRDRKNKD